MPTILAAPKWRWGAVSPYNRLISSSRWKIISFGKSAGELQEQLLLAQQLGLHCVVVHRLDRLRTAVG